MSSLQDKVDKLGIGKLETTPVDLSKLSNLLKNEIIKKKQNFNDIEKINDNKKENAEHDHNKYITTQELNTLMTSNFAARLAQAKLATKTDITDLMI